MLPAEPILLQPSELCFKCFMLPTTAPFSTPSPLHIENSYRSLKCQSGYQSLQDTYSDFLIQHQVTFPFFSESHPCALILIIALNSSYGNYFWACWSTPLELPALCLAHNNSVGRAKPQLVMNIFACSYWLCQEYKTLATFTWATYSE